MLIQEGGLLSEMCGINVCGMILILAFISYILNTHDKKTKRISEHFINSIKCD